MHAFCLFRKKFFIQIQMIIRQFTNAVCYMGFMTIVKWVLQEDYRFACVQIALITIMTLLMCIFHLHGNLSTGFNNLDKNVGLGTDLMSWFVIGALMHFTNNNYFNHKSKLPNLKVHVKRFEANLFSIFDGQNITYISCWYQMWIKYINEWIHEYHLL